MEVGILSVKDKMVRVMNEYKIDVAVLLIFFNRPNTFQKVFEQVKLARPKKLFLYQDAPRKNNLKDVENVKKCREIAENIDWECEVYKYYQTENVGCDPSEYISQKWAFSIVDKCIVLEDDDVPSQSFFLYAKELLDRYENDERINIICGMNNVETYDNGYDYLYSYYCSIWGWASWSRVVNRWVDTYDMLQTKEDRKRFVLANKEKRIMKRYLKTVENHMASGKAHYESIMEYDMMINNTINIIPTKNMISNIGNNGEGGTHSVSNEKLLPKGSRKVLSMKTYEMETPLHHPPYVMEDVGYTKKYLRVMGWGHPLVTLYRRVASLCIAIRYRDKASLTRKFKKLIGKNT